MKRLSCQQVLRLHTMLINETGGSDGLRDEGLLDSALNAPFQSFGGEDLYKTVPAKAARLGFSLINNHAFIDGNKRIGILVMLTFLEMNGFLPDCTDDELIQLGIGLAAGHIDDRQLLDWIIDHV
ncbi:type II toxin-antitoxin system death-on-curing family toxin [Acetobacterium wieringae]|uniref:Toxin Doc n=1 Tax=Acetobacterium wieringae TaxID=52694 RepID=A0A1F2PH47_9FIRM|nr:MULTISPECIES: type II toxin-antitoxin system death-on-curing family toxin [Acetobacterium]MEA4804867.1 type II toxin-antitoxin system death-on-curing family toxin [Acetobacterium wieringae]OFV70304.1 toxin Doc [Acetobacterium wieringae]TYC87112.1 type II toxin-antitoxin system death-on-curing family toxin [Acetobacterium wieringae]URN86041.1 type II toxin-antitoxin system death-on-curing family toxin [Acetobacterium wieringae]UYO64564.1 type II toxin-antitoxin system death-on-curing family 